MEDEDQLTDACPLTVRELSALRAAPPTMEFCADQGIIRIPVPTADAPVTDYCIDLVRLQTTKQILRWTIHLAGKPWMPRQRLREFIRLAVTVRKIKLPPL